MPTSLLRRGAAAAVLTVVSTGLIAFTAPAANAQATRTWVSGVGDDANPCSRTAPCKTFAGAISKTAAGGTISVLDGGGFGAVTITKSITLDGTGTQASLLSIGTNAVNINNPAADVVLRNVDITGTFPTGSCGGTNGVNVLAANSVRLDDVVISGFQRGVALPLGGASSDVFVDVTLNRVDASNNCVAGVSAEPVDGKHTRVVLSGSHISTSNQALVAGPGSEVWVSGSSLSLNNVGIVRTSAAVHDMCGNTMVGNATDSSFTDVAAACAPAPTPVTPAPVQVQVPVYVPTPVAATYCVVPKLTGLTVAKATAALDKAGCDLGKVSKAKAAKSKKGTVLTQAIPARVETREGTKVAVTIGR
ncbi:PASTA domain-containing protein [Nocardioides oleivorans]|uniref:PASTA domain-containing protein n=1 Tax=Nocardioides oleivorans TaxID=273676 RepID=A0A4Q2S1W4_9ACTN|nr:PASTA domain-containing protein [Nocardioides oleivorans]RYB95206.1 PASTA domain-containing protein [Nocardioides oleivorans]